MRERERRRCVHYLVQELVAVNDVEHFIGTGDISETARELAERGAAFYILIRQEIHERKIVEVAVAGHADSDCLRHQVNLLSQIVKPSNIFRHKYMPIVPILHN